MANVLYIGNKNYSSWSLRAWLCLRWGKIPFEEIELALDQDGYGRQRIRQVLAVSPNGRVPALHAAGLVVWDTMAIAEWAYERNRSLWPSDDGARGAARSVSAEMHSGFANVRNDLPMNILRRCGGAAWTPETKAELKRIEQIWGGLREEYAHAGPWLFGVRSIADAFFAPVATRMRTYNVELSRAAQSYCEAILADADFRIWESQSIGASWDKSGYPVIDGLYP